MANTYLTRTIGSGSNGTTFTISFWLKISSTSANHTIVGLSSDSNSTKYVEVALKSNHKLDIQFRNGTSGNNGTYLRRRTNRVFRDVNAWYHIVVRVDSTQSSASDRFRLYINGVQETSLDVDSTPDMPQNYVTDFNNNGSTFRIGRGAGSSSYYLDGLLSHFHFADGQSLAPTVFGETDSTTGEWKIITSPSFTVGTEGFTILKDGNTITDQSSNSNDFSLSSGTLTKSEDCPSNVFCTLNPLTSQDYTFSNGNNTIVRGSGVSSTMGTIAPSSGKWYWEVKLVSGQSNYPRVGIYKASNADNHIHTTYIGNVSGGTGKWGGAGTSQTGVIANGTDSTTAFYSYSNGDILMFAMDNDNGKLWFGKNGTWYTNDNSTTTTGTAIGNGTATPAFSNVTVGENWSPSVFGNDSADVWSCNFGNGYFGTTAVSSAGTNASGNGIFEYDVPTGYTALSTKGLNE